MTYFDHPPCDAVLPDALGIVGAVRDGDPARFLDQLDSARRHGGQAWQSALVMVLASLIPQDKTVGELAAWMHTEQEK